MPTQAPRLKAQGRHTSTQVLRQQSGKAWWSSSKITRSKTRPDKAQREANRRKEEQRQSQLEQEGHEWCRSTPSGSGAYSSSACLWAGRNCSMDWEAYDWSTGPWGEQPASSSVEQSALSGDGDRNIWSSPGLAPHPDFGEVLFAPSSGFEEDASQGACFGGNAGPTEPIEQREVVTTSPCRQPSTPPEAPHRASQDRMDAEQERGKATRSCTPKRPLGQVTANPPAPTTPDLATDFNPANSFPTSLAQPRPVPAPVLQVCPQILEESSRPAGADPLPTPEDERVVKLKPPPLRMGASGLPEVPFPDLREARSYQHMRLSKPVFLASLRLVRGLCCYGCNVSFSIGQLSSHLFSERHQRICLDFSRLGPAEQRIVVQGTAE